MEKKRIHSVSLRHECTLKKNRKFINRVDKAIELFKVEDFYIIYRRKHKTYWMGDKYSDAYLNECLVCERDDGCRLEIFRYNKEEKLGGFIDIEVEEVCRICNK